LAISSVLARYAEAATAAELCGVAQVRLCAQFADLVSFFVMVVVL
jgi:hypothetical protein